MLKVSAGLRLKQVSLTADNIMELVSTCMVVLEAPFPNTGNTSDCSEHCVLRASREFGALAPHGRLCADK